MTAGWRIFVAVGVAALGALTVAVLILLEAQHSQEAYEYQTRQNAREYRSSASIHAERACSGVPRSKAFECLHEQYHAAWERERSQYDLQAQLVTSAWTRAMGLAAVVAMFFGIVGVGLVYATFHETRRAVGEAKRQADAFINAERPHLRFITRYSSTDPKRLGDRLVTVQLENFGQSAAILETLVWDALADASFPGLEGLKLQKGMNDHVVKPGDKPIPISLVVPDGTKFIGGALRYRSRFRPDHMAYFLAALPHNDGPSGVKQLPRQKRKGWPEDT